MYNKKTHAWIGRAAACALAAIVGAGAWFLAYGTRSMQVKLSGSDEAFGNPLMGYAPSAWHDSVGDDVTMLYMDITWRELEPEEGVFDWESIEEENQLDRWRAEGKHIVLRFVCDVPGSEEHMDIPDWLYEKTAGSGSFYDTSYGRGYSPDYRDPVFLACHQKAVAALGERYGRDTLISYIELGSLGHWGEWHIRTSAGLAPMPEQAVREQYVRHWTEAFPQAKILMRRPFAEAAQYGFGIYNDMAGHPEATAEWLDWIQNGGEYDQTGEENALVPMPEAWKTAPIGGELTSSLEMEEMLDTQLERTVSLIRESHTTFLGPKIADEDFPQGRAALLRNMGYRIWISDVELSARPGGGVQAQLTWQNDGVAPLYAAWPVYLQVIDETGKVLEQAEVELSLESLLPGESLTTTTAIERMERWKDLERYGLQLVIVDPMTGQPAVRFANENAVDCVLELWNPF